MGEICEICGRRTLPGITEVGTLECYRAGYQRSQAALAAARRDCGDTDSLIFRVLADLVTTVPDDPERFDDWLRGRVHAARQQFDKLRKTRAALAAPGDSE